MTRSHVSRLPQTYYVAEAILILLTIPRGILKLHTITPGLRDVTVPGLGEESLLRSCLFGVLHASWIWSLALSMNLGGCLSQLHLIDFASTFSSL